MAIIAEVDPKAIAKRAHQKWVDVVCDTPKSAIDRAKGALQRKEALSIAYQGILLIYGKKLIDVKYKSI